MNTVIHTALRRDLERLVAVTRTRMPDGQRSALCAHVRWMLDLLHRHHVSEDEGVWPRVIAKRPDLAPLEASMSSEHATLAAASDRLRAASAAFALDGSEERREGIAAAVASMREAAIPHLEHEEREAMPLVVETLDAEDWKYLDRNHFRKGMSFGESGVFMMWMLDDLDSELARVIRSEIPPPVVWLMSRLYGGRYDRAAATRWGALAGTRS